MCQGFGLSVCVIGIAVCLLSSACGSSRSGCAAGTEGCPCAATTTGTDTNTSGDTVTLPQPLGSDGCQGSLVCVNGTCAASATGSDTSGGEDVYPTRTCVLNGTCGTCYDADTCWEGWMSADSCPSFLTDPIFVMNTTCPDLGYPVNCSGQNKFELPGTQCPKSCSGNYECDSNCCLNGTCAASSFACEPQCTSSGGSCSYNSQCCSGLTCNSGKCGSTTTTGCPANNCLDLSGGYTCSNGACVCRSECQNYGSSVCCGGSMCAGDCIGNPCCR